MARARRFDVLAAGAMALALACGVAARVAEAASPSPSGSDEASGETDPGLEVWLDRPLPATGAPGSSFDLAFSIWDRSRGELAQIGDVFVRLSPAKGSAAPVEAMARADWPGHAATRMTIPAGGVGDLFVGLHGQSCPASGACTNQDLPFAIAGIGPPPDASAVDLYVAAIRPPKDSLVAGVPTTIEVDLSPRGDWDPATLPIPGRLILIAHHPRGPDLANVPLVAGRSVGQPFTGSVSIAEEGDVVLEIDLPGLSGQPDRVFPTSLLRVTVLRAGDAGPPQPAAGGPPAASEGPPIPLIVGGLLGLAAIGFVVRRVFADL
jgi:hypothetical protein